MAPIRLAVTLLALSALPAYPDAPPSLFPPAQPRSFEYLDVGDHHEICYAVTGNPDGKPVFVLHGGPGYGCYPRLTQYFDPTKWRMILHDQRGSGRSRPPGEIRHNTTQHLVADIERLRKHLKIEGRIYVFGGSWGSTLALAYCETHPDQIAGIVLRGIFTGSDDEAKNVFGKGAARQFFPDAVARLEAELPPGMRFTPETLLEVFTRGDDATVRRVTEAWIRFAIKTGKLHATDDEVNRGWGDFDARPGARIDVHYAVNGYFLKDTQLLDNTHKLRHIPITIINGRYDIICPPITAWRLHRQLPQSKLVIVEEAGHSEDEPGITAALLRAVHALE
jgi:proline iminopeptidase